MRNSWVDLKHFLDHNWCPINRCSFSPLSFRLHSWGPHRALFRLYLKCTVNAVQSFLLIFGNSSNFRDFHLHLRVSILILNIKFNVKIGTIIANIYTEFPLSGTVTNILSTVHIFTHSILTTVLWREHNYSWSTERLQLAQGYDPLGHVEISPRTKDSTILENKWQPSRKY